MIFGEGVFGLLIFAFWIWAIVDVISSDPATVRNLPKFGWLLVVILLSTIGALVWLLLGRPDRRSAAALAPRPRFVAPEDGPRWTDDHARRDHYAAMDEELDRRLEEKQRREEDPSV